MRLKQSESFNKSELNLYKSESLISIKNSSGKFLCRAQDAEGLILSNLDLPFRCEWAIHKVNKDFFGIYNKQDNQYIVLEDSYLNSLGKEKWFKITPHKTEKNKYKIQSPINMFLRSIDYDPLIASKDEDNNSLYFSIVFRDDKSEDFLTKLEKNKNKSLIKLLANGKFLLEKADSKEVSLTDSKTSATELNVYNLGLKHFSFANNSNKYLSVAKENNKVIIVFSENHLGDNSIWVYEKDGDFIRLKSKSELKYLENDSLYTILNDKKTDKGKFTAQTSDE